MSSVYALKFLLSSPAPMGTPSARDLFTRVSTIALSSKSTATPNSRDLTSRLTATYENFLPICCGSDLKTASSISCGTFRRYLAKSSIYVPISVS